ncbi:MAG: hypothetical protein ACOH12_03690 [Parvibaculaceae bacterium]
MDSPDSPFAEDIVFISTECKRIRDMGVDVLKLLPKDELLLHLPHPSGQGEMLCGKAAATRVYKLAEEAGRRSGLSRRVTRQTLRKLTGNSLVQRFIVEQREPNKKQIYNFFASIAREAKAKCTDITHFIPCTLMTAQDPEMLKLGRVIFRNRASFRRRMLAHMKHYGRDEAEDWRREHIRRRMAAAAKFYRQFDWVAEVTVEGCDSEISKQIAERAVTSALDCLQLILQAKHSYKMSVGGPALRRDHRAGVTIGKDGKIHPHTSSSAMGHVNYLDGWSKRLEDPNYTRMLLLIGLALESTVNPDLVSPVSSRFIDAAQWFGEASRDDRPASRVIKYVTALERMVMTDEMKDIQKSISKRVAALCYNLDASDFRKWHDDTSYIYDLRSRLVHGSMSPSDPKIADGVWLAARIAEETLLNALGALGEEALEMEKFSTKRLAKWYDHIVATINKIENSTVNKSK